MWLLAKKSARTARNISTPLPSYIRTELAGDWFDSEGGER